MDSGMMEEREDLWMWGREAGAEVCRSGDGVLRCAGRKIKGEGNVVGRDGRKP